MGRLRAAQVPVPGTASPAGATTDRGGPAFDGARLHRLLAEQFDAQKRHAENPANRAASSPWPCGLGVRSITHIWPAHKA